MTERTSPTRTRWADHLSIIAVVVAVIVLGFVAFSTRPWDRSESTPDDLGLLGGSAEAPRPGDSAPDFALPREDGSVLRLSDLRGTPVFLNFWATWCTFCLEEMPDMQRIAEQFDGELVVIGINAGDSVDDGASYAQRLGVSYELLYDTGQEVVGGYRVRAMPTSYFIDGNGEVVSAQFGFLTHDDMLTRVASLLESDE